MIELALGDRLARLAIDRPEAGNRFTTALLGELAEALAAVGDAAPHVLVVEGRGADFCLGRDAGGDSSPAAAEASLRAVVEIGERLRRLPTVVLCSVRGRARGFGAGLVVNADLAIAASGATLAFDELERGFPPTIVMTYLERSVPPKLARELLFAGRRLGAAEAAELGLLNRVIAERELEPATAELADQVAAMDRDALLTCKPFLAEIGGVAPEQRGERAVGRLLEFLTKRRVPVRSRG